MRALRLGLASWLPLALVCSVALADVEPLDDASRGTARQLATEGSEFYTRGDFLQALDRFQRAYAVVKLPTVGIWSARALVKLNRLVEASERYRELARTELPEDAPDAHRAAVAAATLEREQLLPQVPRIRVLLEGASLSEVSIFVDDQPFQSAFVGVQRFIDPGEHRLVARRGADVLKQPFRILAGETRDVTIQFVAVPEPDGAPQPAPSVPITEQPQPREQGVLGSYQRPVAFATLGVGALGLATSAILGFSASSQESRLRGRCPDGNCEPEEHGAVDRFETTKTLTYVGLGAGTLFVGLGGFLLLSEPGAPEAARVAVRVSPSGGAVVGRF